MHQPPALIALRSSQPETGPTLLPWGASTAGLPPELWPIAQVDGGMVCLRIATPEHPPAEPPVLHFSDQGARRYATTAAEAIAQLWEIDPGPLPERGHEVPRGYIRIETPDGVGVVIPSETWVEGRADLSGVGIDEAIEALCDEGLSGTALVALRRLWWPSEDRARLEAAMAHVYRALGRPGYARRLETGFALPSATDCLVEGDLEGMEAAIVAGERNVRGLAEVPWSRRRDAVAILERLNIPVDEVGLAHAATTAGRPAELQFWWDRGARPTPPTDRDLEELPVDAAVEIAQICGVGDRPRLAARAVEEGSAWALAQLVDQGLTADPSWIPQALTHPEPARSQLLASLRRAGLANAVLPEGETRSLLPVLVRTGVVELEGPPSPELVARIDELAARGDATALLSALLASDEVVDVFISDEGLAMALSRWA